MIVTMITEAEKVRLLAAVQDARAGMDKAQVEARKLTIEAKRVRGEAVRAAESAGVAKEEIARAAGLSWPMSRSRWYQVRAGQDY